MKKRLIIAGIIIFIIIITVVIRIVRSNNEKGGLSVSGNIEVTEVNVGFKTPGRLASLLTDEGRPVVKGDRIASLENAENEALVAQNRAMSRNAAAALDKAKKDFERAEVLYRNGAISVQQMDSARTGHDMARSQLQQASAALRTTEVRLGDTVLFAPVSGTILSRNAEEGETVAAGTVVFTIGDLENPWVKVYVKEDKLGLVKLGQKAEVRVDSFPGKIYSGIVTNISSEAEFTPKNVQTREERVKLVFGVKVSVKNINDELKPGMPADVKILVK